MTFTRVEGSKRDHEVRLYALSTCGWCRKTKELLDRLGVAYEFIYADQCEGSERTEVVEAVRALNPRGSYPTLQVDGEVVAGFDEERIMELLG